MLYTRKNDQDYTDWADKIIRFAESSGYEDIKADFSGYECPNALRMLNNDITFTPDFTAKKGESKHYFEIVIKDSNKEEKKKLISKWKALERIANIKGGDLQLFVPHGSYKYATGLLQENHITAKLTKMTSL